MLRTADTGYLAVPSGKNIAVSSNTWKNTFVSYSPSDLLIFSNSWRATIFWKFCALNGKKETFAMAFYTKISQMQLIPKVMPFRLSSEELLYNEILHISELHCIVTSVSDHH